MHPTRLNPTPAQRPLRLAATLALVLGSATWLAACGGGSDGTAATGSPSTPSATPSATQVVLTGTAATGAPIANGQLTATNASGRQVSVTTAADGSYSVSIDEGAPYLLRISDAAGQVLYSYANQAGVANITQLTTLALLNANGNLPLADLAAGWASRTLSSESVLAAAARVNANLRTLMASNGLDANSYNIFATPFTANRSGFDAVLDAARVQISCSASSCSQSILSPQGNVLVNWDGNIATTGITLSWSASGTGGSSSSGSVTVGLGSCKAPQAGTYSMVVQTTVSGLAGVTVPEVCIDGLPGKPSSQDEFCGGSTVTAQLPPGVSIRSCSFSGNTGTIAAQITSPVVLDYSVSYTFVQH